MIHFRTQGKIVVIYFRDIPIHACDKIPVDVRDGKFTQINEFQLRLIKEGICPWCHGHIGVQAMMDGFPPEQKGLGVAKPEDLQNANRPNQYAEETHGHLGRPRHGSKLFYDLLQEMAETHDAKSHDYASDSNPFGNYQFAGKLSAMFSHSPDDAGFVGRLAEKIYRLANLERDGKIPKSESISDTEKDIAVITTLWMASRRSKRAKIKEMADKMKAGEWSSLNQGPGSIIHTSSNEGSD